MKSKEEMIEPFIVEVDNWNNMVSIGNTKNCMESYAQQKALQLIEELENEITVNWSPVKLGVEISITKIKTIFEIK